MRYIKFFEEISLADVPQFGGKNASLGQMIRDLSPQGVLVPGGFALSAEAYNQHIKKNNLLPRMEEIMSELGRHDQSFYGDQLAHVGLALRKLIRATTLPEEVEQEIKEAYKELSRRYGSEPCDVAVRSSATAEDSPTASFAGQYETFLHIKGENDLLNACLCSMASLFTDRAIAYRREKKIGDFDVAMSIGIQKMVRSDLAASGVIFTLEPESGSPNVITIASSYGLGELIVKGEVNADEFIVHKDRVKSGFPAIIHKSVGSKLKKLEYKEARRSYLDFLYDAQERLGTARAIVDELLNPSGIQLDLKPTSEHEQESFSITDEEILILARYAISIDELYSSLRGSWCPMDIEWAKDGEDGKLYIVQARPETVHAGAVPRTLTTYFFTKEPSADEQVVQGQAVGRAITGGKACIVQGVDDEERFTDGDILVAEMTDPDWLPLMRRASAIITDQGGRTCHAAIVSRELGIPAIVGTESATQTLTEGEEYTVDCSHGEIGFVYRGRYQFSRREIALGGAAEKRSFKLFVNVADPTRALQISQFPVDGVGLARLEFIVASLIGVHPMVCVDPDRVTDDDVFNEIGAQLGEDSDAWGDRYVERLSRSIGMIAGAFYPRPVVVRCSDFKSNEYRGLLGGAFFEPEEENPMLGFRGAARYIDPAYASAFALECRAIKHAREVFGFDNIKILVPFVRTPEDGKAVLDQLSRNGLTRGEKGLEVLMMIEIPANIFDLEMHARNFDGFSIGSNDLTQLMLGVDRDSGHLSGKYDERNQAVKTVIKMAIEKARDLHKSIGICGQAPSDYPEIAQFLVDNGISSISLSADALIVFLAGGKV